MVKSIEYSWTVWHEWYLNFETDNNVQHTCLVFQKYKNYFLWLFYLWPFVRCQIHILCGTSFMKCPHHIICHYYWYHTFAQKSCIVTFIAYNNKNISCLHSLLHSCFALKSINQTLKSQSWLFDTCIPRLWLSIINLYMIFHWNY